MDSFVREKGWYEDNSIKPQTPENLAKSISIEAAELLECYQWATSASESAVADELADVLLYAAQLANVAGIDLENAVKCKLKYNSQRTWK